MLPEYRLPNRFGKLKSSAASSVAAPLNQRLDLLGTSFVDSSNTWPSQLLKNIHETGSSASFLIFASSDTMVFGLPEALKPHILVNV
ncbi:uncharacterized protein H6S33_008642 [Morchella sextelata]|uniref:uncharacterized protein n=1 Tax=Morchella sextelata TaxID=1174677 RepID=UPI001D045A9F|nr:uncharacterized protein H6S33_008642 [Morchella sextelata]KAH0602561.1 hypothetical protein H6S33_008642 [Morchella sextelata]